MDRIEIELVFFKWSDARKALPELLETLGVDKSVKPRKDDNGNCIINLEKDDSKITVIGPSCAPHDGDDKIVIVREWKEV